VIRFLYRIYTFFITPIRSSKIINYVLFGFYPKNRKYGDFWDWTSLEMKKNIKKRFNFNMSFLDVGTGPYGVLAFYVKKKLKGKSVVGCDNCEELIINAKGQSSTCDVLFIKSNLFESVAKQYDCIVFNAPYVGKDFGMKIGVLKDDLSIARCSDNNKGTITIEKFIHEFPLYLTKDGLCMLGINHFYIKNEIIYNIINNNKNIKIIHYSKNRLTRSGVYVIKKK